MGRRTTSLGCIAARAVLALTFAVWLPTGAGCGSSSSDTSGATSTATAKTARQAGQDAFVDWYNAFIACAPDEREALNRAYGRMQKALERKDISGMAVQARRGASAADRYVHCLQTTPTRTKAVAASNATLVRGGSTAAAAYRLYVRGLTAIQRDPNGGSNPDLLKADKLFNSATSITRRGIAQSEAVYNSLGGPNELGSRLDFNRVQALGPKQPGT